jgi:hypothetical protein
MDIIERIKEVASKIGSDVELEKNKIEEKIHALLDVLEGRAQNDAAALAHNAGDVVSNAAAAVSDAAHNVGDVADKVQETALKGVQT